MKGRPGFALAAALLTLAPLTAACGAGLDAETLRAGTTIDGVNAQTGDLRVRNLFMAAPQAIEFPANSDIPVYVTVTNIGDRPDTLTEVTSPLGQVSLEPTAGDSSLSPVPSASPAGVPSSGPVALPAGQAVTFGLGEIGPRIVLRQVSKPVRVASFVPLTLRFAESDEVTVQAPVGSGYGPGAGPSPSEPTPAETGPDEEH